MQKNAYNNLKKKRSQRFLWGTIGSVLLIILIFGILVFIILQSQGIVQGSITLTIISIISGVVIGLLGLMFTFFQWFYPRSPQENTSPNLSVTPPTGLLVNNRDALPISTPLKMTENLKNVKPLFSSTEDWEEAYQIGAFYGREQEFTSIIRWITDENCKVVLLLGVGGVGKTALAVKTITHIKHQFQYIFWHSLQNAPPIDIVLSDCIQLLSDHSHTELPNSLEGKLSLLIEYLREKRCLLILDNFETLLQSGDTMGNYCEGYSEYGKLLQYISIFKHQSCLLLTSREKPKDIVLLEGPASPTRILMISGLEQKAGEEILKEKGLFASEETWSTLIHLYSGNPLALKLAAEPIREVFGGNIAEFLNEGEIVISNVYELLDQQFNRLSLFEREIIYWLAIEREAISFTHLQQNILSSMHKRSLLKALEALLRRSFIEKNSRGLFILQPVIMEYVTDKFVDTVFEEIKNQKLNLLESHALIKAQAKDYVRDSQIRLILAPLAKQLLLTSGRKMIEQKLKSILSLLRANYPHATNYVAGNLLNLFIQLKIDLRGYDFSHLTVRQAYLTNTSLPDVNFAFANLATCVFTDTFGSILSIAISANGDFLAAGTSKGEIRVWEISTGTPLYTCQGHTDWVRAVAFSPDGKLLASGSEDCTIRFWDAHTGQCLKVLQGHEKRIWSVAFSSDGELLASGSDDLTIRLWNISVQTNLKILKGHTNWVRFVTFNPLNNLLVSGSGDHTVKLWDITTGECLHTLQGHKGWVYSVACDPNGKFVASGSGDHTVKLWDITTGECLHTLQGHSSWIYSVNFSPDSRMLASGSDDQTIRLWNVQTGQCTQTLQGHSHWVRTVVFHPGGEILTSGSADQTIRFWDIRKGRCYRTLQGYSDSIYSIAISFSNMLASGGDDHIVRLWDITSNRCLKALHEHKGWIYSVNFSPDGKVLASGSDDQTIRLWDIQTGQCLRALQGHSHWVRSVIFHPDGKVLASSADDQTIRLWDIQTGQCLQILQGHISWIHSVAFSPDGKVLASGSDDQTIRLWDVRTGQCLQILQGHTKRVWSVAFSPDGQTLASGSSDQTVKLWNITTGHCLVSLDEHIDWVRSVAFSPDGKVLASGSGDQTIKLWNVATAECHRTLYGHQNRVYFVVFSSKKDMLASTGEDGTIRIWSVTTGEQLKILRNEKQYERMDITETEGLTFAQISSLKILGAVAKTNKKKKENISEFF